jgi:N-acetylmuramic acid 6-phosphate etherase
MPIAEAIRLMLEEDLTIPGKILAESERIEWTIRRVVKAFAEGGRLLYCGAGTSGRLGVLDASECPPTFRTPGSLVQGIIAGGRTALWSAVEGAEDDAAAGRQAIEHRHVTSADVVVGISASGHAPFIWGCLGEAKERGATTVLVCCNPAYRDHPILDQAILPDTGPEILTGSTRLKSGTATKLVLNLITTLAMTHSGKVIGNLMIDLNPSNTKLRGRAVRIVRELTGADERNRPRHPRSDRVGSCVTPASGWGGRDFSSKPQSLFPLARPCLIRTGRRRAFANPSSPAIPPSPRRAFAVPQSGVSVRSGPAPGVVGKPLPKRPLIEHGTVGEVTHFSPQDLGFACGSAAFDDTIHFFPGDAAPGTIARHLIAQDFDPFHIEETPISVPDGLPGRDDAGILESFTPDRLPDPPALSGLPGPCPSPPRSRSSDSLRGRATRPALTGFRSM